MKKTKAKRALAARAAFLTDAELADIDKRNAAANRLRVKWGIGRPGESELGRLVAEVRYWRSRFTPEKLSPAKEKRWQATIRSIKADAAAGRRITLITPRIADMLQTASELTGTELRMVRFDIPGLCLAPRKDK